MNRYGNRKDKNQNEIVKVLIAHGCSVQLLDQVGGGCPDLLVGISGVNLLIEVKDGNKGYAKKLRTTQEEWHGAWKGQVCVIRSAEEAIELAQKYFRFIGEEDNATTGHQGDSSESEPS